MKTADVIVRMAAKDLLQRTRVASLMFAATKEAFVARCAAALEMAGHTDMQGFYRQHIRGYPDAPNSFNLTEAPTEAWALAVIEDALARLNADDNSWNHDGADIDGV